MPDHPAPAAAWSVPPTLSGRHVRLEPLRPDHADALFAAADPATFAYHLNTPDDWTLPAFRVFIDRLLALPGRSTLVLIDAAPGATHGTPIGSTAFLEIRPIHRGLEIGATWISPPYRGTRINPETKLLMLSHAFDTLGAIRVQLKCDARNLHSQAAIAKLGAVREGVLRRHMIAPDGYVRDTVYYSITDDQWPDVRAGLERRLDTRPA